MAYSYINKKNCCLHYTTVNVIEERVIGEKGKTATPSAGRIVPLCEAVSHCKRHKHPRFAWLSFPRRLIAVLFTIRPDLASLPQPCQRTKLDSRPAQYNSNLWMDKGLPSRPCDMDAFHSPTIVKRVGRRILYSAPSTSMSPSDVSQTYHFPLPCEL